MRPFRVRGVWHLPGHDENRVSGILRYTPTSGLRLNLIGALSDVVFGGDVTYPVIHGIVEQQRSNRRFVTLNRSLIRRARVAIPGIQTQELSPTSAYFAGRPLNGDERFRGCRLRFQELDEWADAGKGFSETTSFSEAEPLYRRPQSMEAELEGFKVTLAYDFSRRRRRAALRLTERASLLVSTEEVLDANLIIGRFAQPLVELLELATDGFVDIDECELVLSDSTPGSGNDEFATFVFRPITAVENKTPKSSREMLFTLPDVEGRFETVISEWFGIRERSSAFCGAFFGLIAAPPRFLEVRFYWLLHCVTLLAVSQHAPNVRPGEHRAALNWLIEQIAPVRREVVPQEDVNGATFVTRVTGTLDNIQRGEIINPSEAAWLAELLRWAVRAFLLLQISPLAPSAQTLLRRSERLEFAKSRVQELGRGSTA